jgi:sugar-specific transcriptional regulator TrmB
MNQSILQHIGLTAEQALVYECLIRSGTLSARKIGLETGLNRSFIYKILKQLIEIDLVAEQIQHKKTTKFSAQEPSHLEKLVQKQTEQAQLAKNSYHEVLSTLGSQFNLTHGKPTIRFYEGLEGIKILYKDIIHTGKDIFLIRSPLDNNLPELEQIVLNQIQTQVEKNIKTRVLAPMSLHYDNLIKDKDEKNLVTRCRIPIEEFNISAQIILYGNKVAFTSFTGMMITTILEDKSIFETMNTIFETVWKRYSSNA